MSEWQAVEQVREAVPHFVVGSYAVVIEESAMHSDDCPGCAISPALSLLEQLAEAAEDAVGNALVLLPVTGSDNAGYRPSGSTQTTLMATLEEWNDAAQSICNLHALLAAVRSGRAGA